MHGLFIQFDELVKTTKSHYVIGTITLLTRIGGIIGVGKELLWITIVIFGFANCIYKFKCSRKTIE